MRDTTLLGKNRLACPLNYFIFFLFRSFRRKVLFELKCFLYNELEFIEKFTLETPKNYQLWQHRQIIVERINDLEVFSKDLEDTKAQLSLDSKNIHCWQYRQWILRKINHGNLVESELKYTEFLLGEDVYNNSAWNHRYFLIKASESYKVNKSECIVNEFNNILQFLDSSCEDNESFWNYLAAIVQDCPITDVGPKLSQLIGSPEITENYLYLRFLVRFSGNYEAGKKEICERLNVLHPINRALWSSLCHN